MKFIKIQFTYQYLDLNICAYSSIPEIIRYPSFFPVIKTHALESLESIEKCKCLHCCPIRLYQQWKFNNKSDRQKNLSQLCFLWNVFERNNTMYVGM